MDNKAAQREKHGERKECRDRNREGEKTEGEGEKRREVRLSVEAELEERFLGDR